MKLCRPVAILMENVPDIMNFGGHNVPEEVCEVLENLGYACAYTLLNAAFYGVPQTRERMFLIAHHREIAESVSFPEPTHWVALPRGYEDSRQALSNGNSFAEAHNYVDPPEATNALLPAVTAEEAIGDLPEIDARTLMRKGVLKLGVRRFDSLIPYDESRSISEYARSMKNWTGFEAGNGVYDHVIRYLPRDYPLFARMKEGDQYPEAHKLALKMFDEKLWKLARKGVCIKPASVEYEELKSSIVPPYDAKQISEQMAEDCTGSAGAYGHGASEQGRVQPYPLRQCPGPDNFSPGSGAAPVIPRRFRVRERDEPSVPADRERCTTLDGESDRCGNHEDDSGVGKCTFEATVGSNRSRMKSDPTGMSVAEDGATDVLTPEQRRLVMSRIRGKDTKPEMFMRYGLHGRGLRYRLHRAGIPGKPDMVFPKYRAVVFVHGCFWHGHGCSLFKWPKTRASFWETKINRNMERDRKALAALKADGWRAIVVWECALRGKHRRALPDVLGDAEAFIRHSRESIAQIAEYESIGRGAS